MSSILKQALQPGLNPAWSTRVLGGSFHREAIVDMAAAWRAAPSTASRILACLDVLQPITYRTAQSVVIVADRILAAPMNVLAAGTGMINGSLFFADSLTLTVLRLNRGEDGIWSAVRAGAAFGYHGVRNIYTFAIRLGLPQQIPERPLQRNESHSGSETGKHAKCLNLGRYRHAAQKVTRPDESY